MEFRDRLQRQIDQVGEVLKRLLGILLDITEYESIEEAMEVTNEHVEKLLGISTEELVKMDSDILIERISSNLHSSSNIELLGDVLKSYANLVEDTEIKKRCLSASLLMYNLALKSNKVFSISLMNKIDAMENLSKD